MRGMGIQSRFCSARHAIACLAALISLTGCGSRGPSYGDKAPDYKAALAGAPKPLAALYAQPNALLGGGRDAFDKRLAGLRGYPVVVNQWGSWCAPCRAEFPWFQRLSARYGKGVAFIGIDSQDSDDAAGTFLNEFPLPYPSYTDPDQAIGRSLEAGRGLPDTSFFDPSGKLVFTRQGAYANQADLAADIRRYASPGSGSGA